MEQDQPKYVGDEEAKQVTNIPPAQEPIHPLDEGTVEKAQEFEKRRQTELDAEREEHNRRTAGGDPQED